jgi:hypothetical protein
MIYGQRRRLLHKREGDICFFRSKDDAEEVTSNELVFG